MKHSVGFAVMGLACLFLGRSPDFVAAFRYQEITTAPVSSLRLATSVVEQSYCSNGDVRMSLRFQYTNTGSGSIILPRYSFAFPRYTISRSEKAAARRHHEIELNTFLRTILDQPYPTRGREPSPEMFVILKPGEVYEIETRPYGADVVIRNSPARRLSKGTHVLQISVSTWNEPIALAQELSVIWSKYGILWWQGVTSEPMPFKIENPSSTIKCS